MLARPFRWQPAEGRRHATRQPLPRPGVAFTTLCGLNVTPQDQDFVELGGNWLDPTCWDCDKAWRRHEAIPDIPCRNKGTMP